MHLRNEGPDRLAPWRGLAGTRAGLVRAGALTLASALALSGVTASVASAAPAHGAAAHKAVAASSTPTLASLERQLGALEKPPSSSAPLQETGSTLLYPLVSQWATVYSKAHSNIPVTTAGTGSGTGQADALNGTVQIGASDAYLPPADPSNLLNIPVDVSAQQIDYNIRGVSASHVHLKLTGTILDEIYAGKIRNWDAPALKKLNPTTSLPNEAIVPLHRSDGSGDTFLFSTYLDDQDPSGWVGAQGGPGTQVQWPKIPTALAEKGNQGMEAACVATPGCIAYIGVSFLREAVKDGLAYARVLNGKGSYVLPTPTNIASEVASYKKIPTDASISLIDSKSTKYGYPIVNFEYAIVNTKQPSAATAQAVRAFLAWGMDPRNGSSPKYLAPVYFQALAPNALSVAVDLLKRVQ